MRFQRTHLVLAALATACAAAGARPSFEFGAAAGPLRYEVRAEDANVVETPMGTQETTASTALTVVLEIGQRTPAGLQVSAVFESLEGTSSDQGSFEGGALIGRPYGGTLSGDGTISITSGPETPERVGEFLDPRALLSELLVSLPPTGTVGAGSWPVRRETVWQTVLRLTTVFEGTGTVVGDTTWNGTKAVIIVVEGELEVSGRGRPAGAPAELDFAARGPASTRYVWDGARGVMLASVGSTELAGDISIAEMGLTLAWEASGTQTVRLVR